MSGIPVTIPGSTTAGGLQIGFFFKMAYTANMGTQIVLFQLGLPCSGYAAGFINTNGTVSTAIQAAGNGGNWANTATSSSGISINTWYYLTYCLGYSSPNVCQRMYIYQSGVGWYDSGQQSVSTAVATDTAMTATLALGVNLMDTGNAFVGFQNFPNFAGCEISKFWLRNGNATGIAGGGPTGVNALSLPTSDTSISGMSPTPLIFYNCRQSIPVLAAPSAPVPTTAATGGTVAADTYGAEVTYVNPNGETVASTAGSIVTSGATSTITIPSPGPSGNATGWYAYVTQAGGSTYTRQQVAGTPTVVGTALTLTAPPTSSGAAPPGANTATTGVTSLVDVSGNAYHANPGPNGLQVLTDGPYA